MDLGNSEGPVVLQSVYILLSEYCQLSFLTDKQKELSDFVEKLKLLGQFRWLYNFKTKSQLLTILTGLQNC